MTANSTCGQLDALLHVKKSARPGHERQLLEQVDFLETLPEEARGRFPRVFRKDLGAVPPYALIEDLRPETPTNLRAALLHGDLDTGAAARILQDVLAFEVEILFPLPHPELPVDWLAFHSKRLTDRLAETRAKIQVALRDNPTASKRGLLRFLQDVLDAPLLWVDDVLMPNPPWGFQRVASTPSLRNVFGEAPGGTIHGDLHLANILVSPASADGRWRLIDPRGFRHPVDFAYDVGKLLHSVHGLYDFFDEGDFRLELLPGPAVSLHVVGERCGTIDLGGSSGAGIKALGRSLVDAVAVWRGLHVKLLRLVEQSQIARRDPHWLDRSLLTEALHFLTLGPYHMDRHRTKFPDDDHHEAGRGCDECEQDLRRAVALYVRGVQLYGDWLERAGMQVEALSFAREHLSGRRAAQSMVVVGKPRQLAVRR